MQHSVVVVDDHVLIAEALTGMINKFKRYTVLYEADNGQALVDRFKQPANIPDIVLVDINMPVMNGFEFIDEFNKLHFPGKSDIEIVIFTSSSSPKDKQKAQSQGIKNYLAKP